jgi:RimJ/RimL family protein N-acetyltransferase
VSLRTKGLDDARMDYIWKCDPEVAELDGTIPLPMSFDHYLQLYKNQLRYPTPGSSQFAIVTNGGRYIGNCMYYDLDSISKQAELGIVIGDRDYWSQGYGLDVVTTLLNHMFTLNDLQRIYLHTLDWNARAQRCFTKCGFASVTTVRRDGQLFLQMEVTRQRWEQLSQWHTKTTEQRPNQGGPGKR